MILKACFKQKLCPLFIIWNLIEMWPPNQGLHFLISLTYTCGHVTSSHYKCAWGWCVPPVGQDLKKFSVPSAVWTQAREEAIWTVAPEVGRHLGPRFTEVKIATHWPGTSTVTVTQVRIRLSLWWATTRLALFIEMASIASAIQNPARS